jgi:sugar phosphate permease
LLTINQTACYNDGMTASEGGRTGSPYRWLVLVVGVLAQGSLAAFHQGLPSVGPVLQATFRVSLVQTGAVLVAAGVGIAAASTAWGYLADRAGERRVLVVGLAGAGAVLLLAALARTYTSLFALLVLAGVLGACANAASGRAVMHWFATRERGTALGIRQMATPLGGGLAAAALPFLALRWGLPACFVALGVACLAAAFACGLALRRRAADALPRAAGSSPSPVRDPRIWRLALGGALVVAGQLSLVAYVVLYLNQARGLPLQSAAAVLTVCQLSGAAARVAAGRWSDRLGERILPMRHLALAGCVLLALTATLLDLPLAVVLPLLALTTVIMMSTNGLAFTATGEIAGKNQAGTAMGLQNTALFASGAIAPTAFGAFVDLAGWRWGFAGLALLALAGWLLLRPLVAQERRGWERDRAELSPMAP